MNQKLLLFLQGLQTTVHTFLVFEPVSHINSTSSYNFIINRCLQIYKVNYELAAVLEIESYIRFEAILQFREQRFTTTTLTNNFHVAAMSMK